MSATAPNFTDRASPAVAPVDSLRFLLEAGETLAASLDYRTTLTTLARLAVPAIADWCAVDLLDDTGTLRRLAVAHRDPARIELVRLLEREYPPDPSSPTSGYARLREKRTDWVPVIPDEMLVSSAQDARHLELIRSLGLRSFISVPLIIRGEAAGLFTIVTAESGRTYAQEDMDLVRELARRASAAIEQARTAEFARGVVDSIADPMVIYDERWRVRYENQAALEVFRSGGRASSMIGRTLWEEYPDLVGTAFEREMRRTMTERQPTSFTELRRRTGHWTDVRCYPLPDGGVAAVWRDITPQKRAETALRYLAAASETLATSLDYNATMNAFAALMVPELADWCSISILEGDEIRLVAVAHRDPASVARARALNARHAAGRDARTRTARVIREGKAEVIPEITDDQLEAMSDDPGFQALAREVGFRSMITVPLRVRDRVLGAMSLVLIEGESGRRYADEDLSLVEELAHRAAMALDNARLFSEAVEARAAAEAANRAKTDFLARMSHELRTPLNAIGGYAELLSLGIRGPITPEQLHDLQRIGRSQHHLLGLINDVLNYAKLEAGRLQYDIQPTSVLASLGSVEPMFGPQLQERRIAFSLQPVDPSLRVAADGEKLQQILLNVVSNATKFTPPGGTITVSAVSRAGTVEIVVQDTGPGIPDDKLETVFEPFVQLRRDKDLATGTGLGLSISRELAIGMGGSLRAERSEVGAKFVLTLPRS